LAPYAKGDVAGVYRKFMLKYGDEQPQQGGRGRPIVMALLIALAAIDPEGFLDRWERLLPLPSQNSFDRDDRTMGGPRQRVLALGVQGVPADKREAFFLELSQKVDAAEKSRKRAIPAPAGRVPEDWLHALAGLAPLARVEVMENSSYKVPPEDVHFLTMSVAPLYRHWLGRVEDPTPEELASPVLVGLPLLMTALEFRPATGWQQSPGVWDYLHQVRGK
jgi:hypothetical protein